MNLWFRLLLTLLLSRRRSRCGVLDSCITPFRVLPTDLDTAMHMNNGIYFSLLDLGLFDLTIRAGTFRVFTRNGWFGVAAAKTIQFHRALLPFERFFVETRFIGWDERTFFVQHHIFRHRADGELVAEAITRGVMARRAGGTVPMDEMLAAAGNPDKPAPMPEWVVNWANAMDAHREVYKQQHVRT